MSDDIQAENDKDMTIYEIDDQIRRLELKREELIRMQAEELKNEVNKYIGRCFKMGNFYIKFIGIPKVAEQVGYEMSGKIYYFPTYIFPVIRLVDGIIPFKLETFESADFREEWICKNYDCHEVTKEEFEAEFEKRIARFRKNVLK